MRTVTLSSCWRKQYWTIQARRTCCQKMVTPAARREAVAHLQALLDVSERRVCRVIDAGWTVIRYQSHRDDDGALREKLRELAHQRRRFGYRRLPHPAAPRGPDDQPQEDPAPIPGGRLGRAAARGTQTCGWCPCPGSQSGPSQCATAPN